MRDILPRNRSEPPNETQHAWPTFSAHAAYYDYVAHGYDLITDTYDDVEGQNSVARRIRAIMRDALFHTFEPGDRVLEIGCGTGLDAIALASRGVYVVATDVSQGMLQRVQDKVRAMGLSGVSVRRLAAHEVSRLAEEFGDDGFDGAYSHAGALNMEPRLSDVGKGLARLVRPEGRFICTVVNQGSLFETLFYPLFLRPRKAFRRYGNVIPLPVTRLDPHNRYVIPSRFYSPRAFFAHFAGAFTLRRLVGLQIFLPPWNLAEHLDRMAPLGRAVEAVENRLAQRTPFNAWGNLFLMGMERMGK